MKKTIFFTVTNDLSYDQRMHRICNSLAENGYDVLLIGRQLKSSLAPEKKNYRQTRLKLFFSKGKLFYLEYNFRLLIYLLFNKFDIICSIDLDTILPGLVASKIKGTQRVYDAHELFTELKEVQTNPLSSGVWSFVEKIAVPRFKNGYTVCESIAAELNLRHGVTYKTIRNLPLRSPASESIVPGKKFIYTGAVNEARGFEVLIPAMRYVNYPLVICGDGNFMREALELTKKHGVSEKIIFKGMLHPQQLRKELASAYIGLNLVENTGLNQYYSLANKFFDYIQSGVPQISMNFPEYKRINDQFQVALLIEDLKVQSVADAMNKLVEDFVLYENLKRNCLKAREELIWENEANKLLSFYDTL